MVAGALEADQAGLTRRQLVGLVLAPLVGIVLWFLPTHESLVAQRAIAIAAATIVLWITEAVDHATAGFIGLAAYWASGVGTPGQIFSGFTGETPWFLMGAVWVLLLVPAGFYLRFGTVGSFGWVFTIVLIVFCLLAGLGFFFIDRPDYHTTVTPKNDWLDKVGSSWLLVCAFGPLLGWMITALAMKTKSAMTTVPAVCAISAAFWVRFAISMKKAMPAPVPRSTVAPITCRAFTAK